MSARLRSQLGLPLLAALGLGAAAWAQGYSASDLGGRAPASAFGINPAGRIVGSITPADQSRATLWPRAGESPVQLELLPGTNWSRAFGINARGQIVGQAQDKTVLPVQVFAMFWRIADAVPVALAGGTIAVAINNAGQIAGNMRTDLGEIHAALWADSTSDPVDLRDARRHIQQRGWHE